MFARGNKLSRPGPRRQAVAAGSGRRQWPPCHWTAGRAECPRRSGPSARPDARRKGPLERDPRPRSSLSWRGVAWRQGPPGPDQQPLVSGAVGGGAGLSMIYSVNECGAAGQQLRKQEHGRGFGFFFASLPLLCFSQRAASSFQRPDLLLLKATSSGHAPPRHAPLGPGPWLASSPSRGALVEESPPPHPSPRHSKPRYAMVLHGLAHNGVHGVLSCAASANGGTFASLFSLIPTAKPSAKPVPFLAGPVAGCGWLLDAS